jgi:hypothetical protein
MLRLTSRAALQGQSKLSFTSRSHPPFLRSRVLALKPATCGKFAQRRDFVEIPTVLLPPVIFVGLVVSLWTWKCFMMVVFQNKIIYMPGLPPNARKEKIADYKNQCNGISWREEKTDSIDSTSISLCVASVESEAATVLKKKDIHILYFQGHYIPLLVTSDIQLIYCR